MMNELDILLDQSLARMQAGEASVDSSLLDYPEQAEALRPLLELAAHSHKILSPDPAQKAFIKTSQARVVRETIRRMESKKARRSWWTRRSIIGLRPAYALVALALVLTLVGGGVGVVSASADTLPGDSLYSVKLASEQIQLIISLSDSQDAELYTRFAEQRLSEAEKLIELARYEDLDQVFDELDDLIEGLVALEGTSDTIDGEKSDKLEQKLEKHLEVLTGVLERVPDSAKPAIQKVIERSQRSQEKIKKIKSDDHPSNQAPGQLDKDKDNPGRGNGRDKDKPEKTERP